MSLDIRLYLEASTGIADETVEVYIDNIEDCYLNVTHNLGKMAKEVGLYTYLWRADELHSHQVEAWEIIYNVEQGLNELKHNPNKYKKFNPSNGWGTYDNLVEFTEKYLLCLKKYPKAKIEISR